MQAPSLWPVLGLGIRYQGQAFTDLSLRSTFLISLLKLFCFCFVASSIWILELRSLSVNDEGRSQRNAEQSGPIQSDILCKTSFENLPVNQKREWTNGPFLSWKNCFVQSGKRSPLFRTFSLTEKISVCIKCTNDYMRNIFVLYLHTSWFVSDTSLDHCIHSSDHTRVVRM